ncbi:histidine kinase dimerization/phosphoacceptor domain -containing protein [Tabrizicola sp.]|uniref:histidine kinase dimerization/phosphoacceptor domain -containing protein n=1 Tax=Tabrizicola sp. TaxID=2005166 RepID=UPI00286B2589|nr:histidine kinase dimerization/phosphoacceptor domain -containing protein [Tabrizicola sp.]
MIPNAAQGPVVGRLGFRLMAAFGIALMPLALLSYNQAQKFETESVARWESALFGETLLAAASQIEAMSRARGLAAALAIAIVPELNDLSGCIALMKSVTKTEDNITFAGFIPTDGKMTCGSTGKPYDFSGSPGLAPLLLDPRPVMTVNTKGPITGESVLIFSHPVRTPDGQLVGFISLSVTHRALKPRPAELHGPLENRVEPLALITFDGEGTVLTSAFGIEAVQERLPANRKLTEFIGIKAATFRDTIPTGEPRTFAVVAIVPGSFYVLGSWPAALTANSGFGGFLPLWVFPLAMWLASMLVAYLASENQVLRHIRVLRQSIIAFAGGNRRMTPPDLSAAPNELREVGQAYERMMGAVLRDEAAMEDSIHQKEILLREVHHRVKNNLQLIASIMNLQIRKSVNPEAQSLLRGLHERVMSLATVHRELYQTSGLVDVRADELLESIVAQVLRMGARSDQRVEAKTAFDDIRLTPDQAVPLSLMLTEALTNALKHARPSASGQTRISVTLRRSEPGHAMLEVANSDEGGAPAALPSSLESTGLGQQLLTAFASQLMGKLTVGPENGAYVVRLEFPLMSLNAEAQSDDAS